MVGVVNNNTISFGVARCSKNDQFTKKMGRIRALGRAKSSRPYHSRTLEDNESLPKAFLQLAKNIVYQVNNNPKLIETQKKHE